MAGEDGEIIQSMKGGSLVTISLGLEEITMAIPGQERPKWHEGRRNTG